MRERNSPAMMRMGLWYAGVRGAWILLSLQVPSPSCCGPGYMRASRQNEETSRRKGCRQPLEQDNQSIFTDLPRTFGRVWRNVSELLQPDSSAPANGATSFHRDMSSYYLNQIISGPSFITHSPEGPSRTAPMTKGHSVQGKLSRLHISSDHFTPSSKPKLATSASLIFSNASQSGHTSRSKYSIVQRYLERFTPQVDGLAINRYRTESPLK